MKTKLSSAWGDAHSEEVWESLTVDKGFPFIFLSFLAGYAYHSPMEYNFLTFYLLPPFAFVFLSSRFLSLIPLCPLNRYVELNLTRLDVDDTSPVCMKLLMTDLLLESTDIQGTEKRSKTERRQRNELCAIYSFIY